MLCACNKRPKVIAYPLQDHLQEGLQDLQVVSSPMVTDTKENDMGAAGRGLPGVTLWHKKRSNLGMIASRG